MDVEVYKHDPLVPPPNKSMFRMLPFLVLIISLVMTSVLWQMVDSGFRQEARHDFKDKAYEIVFMINEVLRDHEQVLRGGVGLFNTNGEVTREQWHRYVASQQFNRIHPGIVGVGYAEWLTATEKESHIRKLRATGIPEYVIWPEGDRREYCVITFLEPFTGFNRQSMGFDMYSETNRHTAMDRSRGKGITSISSGVTLIQKAGQKTALEGMVMYLPVYRLGAPAASREQRQASIKGFVFSPIKMKEFVYGTLGTIPTNIAFEIYDGDAEQPDKLMFSSLSSEKVILPKNYEPDLKTSHKLEVYGRTWTVAFKSLPVFTDEFHRTASRMALGGGILVSMLLAGITYTLQTNRDRALALAQAMTRELRGSEETVRLILDTAGEAIYGIDIHCRCTFCNPAGLFLLGYKTEEEVLGLSMHNLLHYSDDGSIYPCTECTIKKVMMSGTGCHLDDVLFWRSDGTSFSAEYWAMPKCKDGQVIGAVVSFMDIVERKRSEAAVKEQADQLRQEVAERRDAQKALLHYQRQLESLNRALEERVIGEVAKNRTKDQLIMQQEKMVSIGQLAAGVAHEINTPLAFIASNLRVLARYFQLILQDKDQWAVAASVNKETNEISPGIEQILVDGEDLIAESLDGAERVAKIVLNLKSFSRVDLPEQEPVVLTTCLESALNVACNELKDVVTIKREYGPLPEILCYPGQLNQLFLHLLVNARQAIIPPGEITLRCWHDDSSVYVSVSDTGHGIPEEILGRIFEPFFTTKDVGQGTGMGLSIAYEIVKNHDGSLLVESEVAKGTTFTVVLPWTLKT